jgi:hypothetical protein
MIFSTLCSVQGCNSPAEAHFQNKQLCLDHYYSMRKERSQKLKQIYAKQREAKGVQR